MNKRERIDELARAAHLTKEGSETVVTTVVERLTAALVKGERVEVRRFGTFAIRHRAPLERPAQKIPFFKMGKELRAKLNPELGLARQDIPVASARP